MRTLQCQSRAYQSLVLNRLYRYHAFSFQIKPLYLILIYSFLSCFQTFERHSESILYAQTSSMTDGSSQAVKPQPSQIGASDQIQSHELQKSNEYPVANRHTIQNKFFSLKDTLILGLSLVSHQRDDYYDSIGGGLNISYFWSENTGVSFKWMSFATNLGGEAEPLRKNYGFTPDATPQSQWFLLGIEHSLGYGKILFRENRILQFDSLVTINGGIATADQRIIPTLLVSFSPTFYLKNLFKIRFDFGLDLQLENRTRGYVLSTAFVPGLTVAWGGTWQDIATAFRQLFGIKEQK